MRKLLSIMMTLIILTTFTLTGCNKSDKSSDGTQKGSMEKSDSYSTTTQNSPVARNEDEVIADTTTSAGENQYKNDSMDGDTVESKSSNASTAYLMDKDIQYEWEIQTIPGSEEFTQITERGFQDVIRSPLSTFSIDVDTASYAYLRRNINYGMAPEVDMIRIEEMLNYFSYDYEEPSGNKPFAIHSEIGPCPWNSENYLLMVGIQGKKVNEAFLPKSNLVFLIDVSGSMDEPDKLPLLKDAFSQLVEELGENDRVSIVVYAGSSGVVLNSARGDEKKMILEALEALDAGGSTAGAKGIELAYKLAEKNFIKGGNNRVILATDGDFNVGPSSMEELEEIIKEKKDSGVFLSVIGFGTGNIKDNKMELLADKGNGNYSYIDSPKEAKKVLVDERTGTLLTIAKDVKIQLEFNPDSVEAYRLIGYENRALASEDFKNDKVDAGELGAGHSVTAIYEVIPGRASNEENYRQDLKYQSQNTNMKKEYRNEITEIRLRYKEPDHNKSEEIRQVVFHTPVKRLSQSEDFYFAASVAEFGMILRNSEYRGDATIESVLELAEKGLGKDPGKYRKEFIDLVEQYQDLSWLRW